MLESSLSLCQLLDPEVLANPYPLYQRLRELDPVHWDPFLNAWVVTRYEDVGTVLRDFAVDRPPSFGAAGDGAPVIPLRAIAGSAFSARRLASLCRPIQEVADRLIDT